MKKLLYIVLAEFENPANGVGIKVHGQIAGMEQLGYDVYCATYGVDGVYVFHKQEKVLLKKGPVPNRILFMSAVREYLKKNSFDISYIRYPHIDWDMKQIIKHLKKNRTTIYLEVPTYPMHKPGLKQDGVVQIAMYYLDKIFTRDLNKYIDKVLYIGNPTESLWKCDSYHIANGCDVEQYPLKSVTMHDRNSIKLIAVAGMFLHHGFERLLRGMAQYYQQDKPDVEITLHLVGDGPELDRYKGLCAENHLERYVKFEGFLSGTELDALYNAADIAITSLGLYKEGITCASTLKAKEYLSRGISFVLACEEEGLDSHSPYILKVENDDSTLDMKQIIAFYEQVRAKDYREEMRRYAVDHYTWKSIYERVF